MISYYELLDLVKNKKQPEEIEVKLCDYTRKYHAEYDGDEFSYYYIDDNKYPDENYHNYLADSFLESEMFKRCITIVEVEEKPKKIEEIKKRYDKQAITNYKQANFNSADMKEICKTIGFLMQYLDEARDTINDLAKAVNYLLEKESDK